MKIGELAQRAGVTTRTLHHYDQIGLLSPSGHTENGYREYGPDDAGRLYRILALRELGLALTEIADVLDGGQDSREILARQHRFVQAEIRRQELLSRRLERLQALLGREESPGLDDWFEVLQLMRVQEKYLSADDVEDMTRDATTWQGLVGRARQLMADGTDPGASAAREVARDWLDELRRVTGGRPDLWRKLADMLIGEPRIQAHTGIDKDVLQYLSRAIAKLPPSDDVEAAVGIAAEVFDAAYERGAPWDIGRIQPSFAELLATEKFAGPVLEVGCGTGDLALAFAQQYPVLAVDLSALAIEGARAKAKAQGRTLDVEFRVQSALDLDEDPGRFGTILDCGFLHTLSAEERAAFVGRIAQLTGPGARYVVLGFATRLPLPNAPAALSVDMLRGLLQPSWSLQWSRPTRFVTRWAQEGVPALMCSFVRTDAALDPSLPDLRAP
jgi:MerR family transcriptional regulator, thiopeptide resistance regulator